MKRLHFFSMFVLRLQALQGSVIGAIFVNSKSVFKCGRVEILSYSDRVSKYI